jgi:hypothetical protein
VAVWQDSVSGVSEAPLNLAVTKFTYSNEISSVEDSFVSSNSSWVGQTATQTPFFLMSNTK